MIELKAVTKRYSTVEAERSTVECERPALDGIDLFVERGEFVAVMGPSGCGKTTLLNIVGLIDAPTTGRYMFANQDLAGRSENELTELRKRNIAFIFQAFQLIPELSIYENVELPLRYQSAPRARRRTAVREVLELVGLDARVNDYPEALSGGEQQRVAIARALVNDPKVILADEPTGNLDRGNGSAVLDMLCTLNREGATVIMVTHSPSCAERAGRVVHLLDGRVVSPAQTRI